MPVISHLPALEIILGLKGVLDFYYWKGIPCVRKWPRIPPSSRTPASLAAAALFGSIIQGYALVGATVKILLQHAATDQPRTPRDLYVSAVLGHLHEINMDEIIALLEQLVAYNLTLTALVNALNSVATDQLLVKPGYDGAAYQPLLVDASKHAQVDVLSSALPATASTAALQADMVAALEKIDDLQAALESVQTDRLQVRGEDQLFSFKTSLASYKSGNPSGDDGYMDSFSPAEGEIWVATSVSARDTSTAITKTTFIYVTPGPDPHFNEEIKAFVKSEHSLWTGQLFLLHNDVVRVIFTGSLAADTCVIEICGYIITLES